MYQVLKFTQLHLLSYSLLLYHPLPTMVLVPSSEAKKIDIVGIKRHKKTE